MALSFKQLIRKSIPSKIKRMILPGFAEYEFVEKGYATITYSQQGEDIELNRLFPTLKNGFYVDVGAFHPFKYSNTYKLYQRGWRGINIEPNPDQIELFKTYRSKDINLNAGVSSSKTLMKYYIFNESAVNTFIEENAISWSKANGFKIEEIQEIPTNTLKNIFEDYLPSETGINLMNIDVEGMDIEVLESNDWEKFRPQVILIEDAWYIRDSLNESIIKQFLEAKNYKLWNIVGITLFFTDKTFQPV